MKIYGLLLELLTEIKGLRQDVNNFISVYFQNQKLEKPNVDVLILIDSIDKKFYGSLSLPKTQKEPSTIYGTSKGNNPQLLCLLQLTQQLSITKPTKGCKLLVKMTSKPEFERLHTKEADPLVELIRDNMRRYNIDLQLVDRENDHNIKNLIKDSAC